MNFQGCFTVQLSRFFAVAFVSAINIISNRFCFVKTFLKLFLFCCFVFTASARYILSDGNTFVNTFFHFFELFFIILYIVDYFLSYILFPLQKQKNMPAFAGIFNQRYTTLVKIHHTIIIILIELLTYLCLSPIYESAYAINTPPITVANGMYL